MDDAEHGELVRTLQLAYDEVLELDARLKDAREQLSVLVVEVHETCGFGQAEIGKLIGVTRQRANQLLQQGQVVRYQRSKPTSER